MTSNEPTGMMLLRVILNYRHTANKKVVRSLTYR